MPNYSLETSLRSFDPTRLAFLAEMQSEQTKSLREAQAAYSELMSEANLYDKLANDVMGTNSQAYKNAKSYADALRQHTDLLATQGLTNSTMRNLLMARTDAARIINPIKEGLERRQKIADYQKEYNEKHPEALWERDVSQMGIDQIMKNPNYTPKVIDRKELANRAKERYEALKNQLMEFYAGNKDMVDALSTKDPRVAKQWYKTNAPWYWEAMEKYGMNPADVHRLLAGDPSMEGTLLKNIADETLRMSGFDSWNTDYDHYTAEQNAQNRANLADQVYMSILPESVNSINKTDFDQYQDNLDAQIIMEREGIASREKIAQWQIAADLAKQGNNNINPDDAAQLSKESISMGYDNDQLNKDLNIIQAMDWAESLDENSKKRIDNIIPSDLFPYFADKSFASGQITDKDPETYIYSVWKQTIGVGTGNNMVEDANFNSIYDKINKLERQPLYADLFKKRLLGQVSDEVFNSQSQISAKEFDDFVQENKKRVEKSMPVRTTKFGEKYSGISALPKMEDLKNEYYKKYGLDYDPSKTVVGTDYIIKDMENTNGTVWPRFVTSVLDNTARKNFARATGESLRNQGSDRTHLQSENGDGYMTYKIGENFKNSDFNNIAGYDENGEYQKVPTFWLDPKSPDKIYVQYGGSDKTFSVKTSDWNGGINQYGTKLQEMAAENHEIYELYTNYKKREDFIKKVDAGDKTALKKYNNYLQVIESDPEVKNSIIQTAAAKGIPVDTPERQRDVVFKSALLANAYNINHDAMNVVVKGGSWGKGDSGTTPEEKVQLYQFVYDNI